MLILTTGYLIFQSSFVQNRLINLITGAFVADTEADFTIGRVDVKWFRHLVLEDVFLSDESKDTLIYCKQLTAKVDSFSMANKRLILSEIKTKKASIHLHAIDSLSNNFDFLLPDSTVGRQPIKWNISARKIDFRNGTFVYEPWKDSLHSLPAISLKKLELIADEISYGPEERFSFQIRKMKFNNKVGPSLNNLVAKVSYSDSVLSLTDFTAETDHSSLSVPAMELDFSKVKQKGIGQLGLDIELAGLEVGLADLSMFRSYFSGSKLKANCSGWFSGTLSELKGKGVMASFDQLGCLTGDFYLNGLPDFENTYIFVDLSESSVDVSSIRKLQLPEELKHHTRQWPKFLDNLGSFQYQGNFSGFFNDFVAYGTFSSDLGTVRGDVSFKPGPDQSTLINGHVATQNLDLGVAAQNKLIGKLSLSGDVNGWFDNHNYNLDFNGSISSLGFMHYQYSNIHIDGLLKKKRFEGKFSIDDPNLLMAFSGGVDFSPKQSVFDFVARVDRANLGNLKLYPDSLSKASFVIESNFTGKNIDNFIGQVKLEDVFFKNSIDSLVLKHIDVKTVSKRDSNMLLVKSDWLDAEVSGNYNFEKLFKSAQNFYRNYLPSTLSKCIALENDPNRFSFNLNIKNIEPFTRVFFPDLLIKSPFVLAGVYQPSDKNVWIETKIPRIGYQKQSVENLSVRIEASEMELTGKINSDVVHLSDSITLYNCAIDSKSADDQIDLDMAWNHNLSDKLSSAIKTRSKFSINNSGQPHINLHILPSGVYVYDSLWQIGDARIEIDSTTIGVNGIKIERPGQYFRVDGTISKDEKKAISARLNNVDLKLFDQFLGESLFTGRINGDVQVKNFYSVKQIETDLTIKDLSFSGGKLGDLFLISNWDNKREKLFTKISLQDQKKIFLSSKGYIGLNGNELDLDVELDRAPFTILDVFMPDDFDSFTGIAEGKVKITGPLKHLLFKGKIQPVGTISMGLNYLNTVYHTSDPIVFSNDTIYFPDMKIFDEHNNSGIFSGNIQHESFLKMMYNMSIVSDKLLVMDNTVVESPYFYGTAFVGGNIFIVGRDEDLLLSGNVRSSKGTQISIPFETPTSAVSYNFIQFESKKEEKQEEKPAYDVVTEGFKMNFDLELTPDAKVQMIINSQSGEIIKGEGNGNLNVKVDRNFNIELYGGYEIEKGDYLFTLQNVINKKFTIDQGGTLNWTGDPYNARVDLKAVYKLNASLKDLLLNSYSDIDVSRRIPVNCNIQLSDELLQPNIHFQIDLPTADDRVKEAVSQVIVTEEDKNRQMISLLLMGRFYTPEYIAGTASTVSGSQLVQSTLGSTVSELFSNQISNWANQITNLVDVGFNYRPGNNEANDQFEMALGTQFLNDRVMLNGNIANNANPNSGNTSAIVGDFDLMIKLTDNGKLQFKAYTHTNDHSIEDLAPNTQGLGFIYKEEFNTIKELFLRYKEAIFGRKKKKSSTP